MAQTCVDIPITSNVVSTAHSTFTTMSLSTSMGAGSTSATVIQNCITAGSGNATSTSCAETTSYVTYQGDGTLFVVCSLTEHFPCAARVYLLIRQEGIDRNFSGTFSLNASPIVKTVVPMLPLSSYLTATSLAPMTHFNPT